MTIVSETRVGIPDVVSMSWDADVVAAAESRKAFDEYNRLRYAAAEVDKISGPQLESIRAQVAGWVGSEDLLNTPAEIADRVDYYTQFSEERASQKILGLVDYLEKHFPHVIAPVELEATRAFVNAAFRMYEATPATGEVMPDADGSFAFVVPCRMSRKNVEYGQEVEPVIPAFRYLPMELRSQMLVGMPPFVVTEYMPDKSGRQGRIVFAPVSEDLIEDFSGDFGTALEVARQNTAAAVEFAYRRFGISVAGLGAILPSLTHYGQKLAKYSPAVASEAVITTTGHGGTEELICMTVDAALGGQVPESIGVLGVGAIGAATAETVADRYPQLKVNIYDTNKEHTQLTARNVGADRVNPVNSLAELMESQVVVSAVTGRIDLENIPRVGVVVDDCQPGSMDREQVEQRGGQLRWVIGSTAAEGCVLPKRIAYSYGDTVGNPNTDAFGCELEAASLAEYARNLRAAGVAEDAVRQEIKGLAIRGPLKAPQARAIGALFLAYGVRAAAAQAFGQASSAS